MLPLVRLITLIIRFVISYNYLTDSAIDKLRKAARSIGRHGVRDDAIILLMFRHGLRVSEAITLRWDKVDFQKGAAACQASA